MRRVNYRPHVRCLSCGHETRRLLRSRDLLAPCPRCGSPSVDIKHDKVAADGRVRIRVDVRASTFRALQAAGVPIGSIVRKYLQDAIARGEI